MSLKFDVSLKFGGVTTFCLAFQFGVVLKFYVRQSALKVVIIGLRNHLPLTNKIQCKFIRREGDKWVVKWGDKC